jgi:hypothetical protein
MFTDEISLSLFNKYSFCAVCVNSVVILYREIMILLLPFDFDGFVVWGKQKTTKQTNVFGTEAVFFFLVSLKDLLIMFSISVYNSVLLFYLLN